jgi:parallel beta-helix repeat protein
MKSRIKTIAFHLMVFIFIQSVLVITTHAEQISQRHNETNYLVVDKNGNGDYQTLMGAIQNSQAGSTIYVKQGEYNEILNINKPLSIIGEDKENTLINPVSEKNKYAIYLGAPNTMIRSLSIKNGAPGLYTNAVRISASNTKVQDCNIFDTPVGIAIWTSGNIIDGCKFWNCKDEGIALLGSTYSNCENNLITNCIFYDNCDGIELQHSSSNTIANCEFYDNTHVGIDAISSGNDNNIITNCKIYNNQVYGIYLASSSENQIINCIFSENEDGDIIMNRYSMNNLIVSSSNSEDIEQFQNTNSKRDILRNLFNRIFNRLSERIKSFFSPIYNF